jgi:hypothetical protein
MKKIIPISDLQRQSSRCEQSAQDLSLLDELELREMVARGAEDVRAGRTISQRDVRARLRGKRATRLGL